jgi:DNA-binding NtrC family response regulator
MPRKKNKHEGSTLESLLREEGIYAEVTARAIKEVLAEQLAETMEREGISKSEMARRLETSRSALDRLLDPEDPNLNLKVFTLAKVAEALGKRMEFRLSDA